ncbi:glycerol-3-phosphate dehydrogenase [uncultured Thiothrix sp.]|uniref:glycerol-3-phosphate dehydrogenase n=1 Tax=uncultured Thiothrix sp. TaxID=223185 RepID=UPI002626B71F|nr:glycerol-3-phosphate dehydrogenase [uncultured Thiothrix sp.]
MLNSSSTETYDMVVIGGGINGCGIARDAVGRGLKVLLAEQGDLAQGTSSASTKLIHGGLRYLEYYEFRLVREALSEREVLLKNAPHIIWPLRFVLPNNKAVRPAWLVRLGLFLYDHIGGRKLLPATQTFKLHNNSKLGDPIKEGFEVAFEYSDCWVDDARLVVLNALDAAKRGADIRVQTRCIGAQRQNDLWQIQLENTKTKQNETIQARILVNATGPWIDHLLHETKTLAADQHNVRLVRGSHIIVPKLYEHDRAYFFQNTDGRIMFAIPYEQAFTLLGTTDADHKSGLERIQITEEETQYLCDSASLYFKNPIKRESVVWTYAGVRPLYDDGASKAQAATREYVLRVEDENGQAPLLNVFGGKITTYRCLAEDALSRLAAWMPNAKAAWTKEAALPGGQFDLADRPKLVQQLQHDYSFVDGAWANSLISRYGKRAWELLGDAKNLTDLGRAFGATLTEREVNFLRSTEWATDADSILWRRTKLGLHMTPEQREAFAAWLQ